MQERLMLSFSTMRSSQNQNKSHGATSQLKEDYPCVPPLIGWTGRCGRLCAGDGTTFSWTEGMNTGRTYCCEPAFHPPHAARFRGHPVVAARILLARCYSFSNLAN